MLCFAINQRVYITSLFTHSLPPSISLEFNKFCVQVNESNLEKKYLLLNGWSHTQHGSLNIHIPMRRSSVLFFFFFFPLIFIDFFFKQKAMFMGFLSLSLSISPYNREKNQTLNNGIEAKQLFIIEKNEWMNEREDEKKIYERKVHSECICLCVCLCVCVWMWPKHL